MASLDSGRAAGLAAILAIAWLAAACETARSVGGDVVYELNPFGATDLLVNAVEVHAPYLLVELTGRREHLRFLAPANPACAALLRPEAPLRYAKSGSFGRVTDAKGAACDLVGIASLAAWRDRRPVKRGELIPRSSASFTVLARDAQLLLLRGRFAIASRIGIPGTYDIVALVPNDAPCRAVAERGAASLEFRPAGPNPYRMLEGDTACEVMGFAVPPAP